MLLLLLTGCGGAKVTPAVSREPTLVTMDDQLAEIGREVPGFGGLYIEAQSLVIYLADPSAKDAAIRAINEVFGPEVTAGRSVVVKTGDYTMEHLSGWYDRLRTVNLDVIWTDLDEARNRIALGVKTREAKARVEAEIDRLMIPRAAVIIESPGRLLSEENPVEGCLLEAQPPMPDGPSLLLSTSEVKPGERITLTLPVEGKVSRGGYADLECWSGSEWMPIFELSHRNGVPSAYLYGGVRADVGHDGPGPEPALIPTELKPGWYRIRKDGYLQPGGSQAFFGLIHVYGE